MSHPHWQDPRYRYAQAYASPQPLPAYPPPHHGAPQWVGDPAPPTGGGWPAAAGAERQFRVRLRKHTGLVVAWYSRSYTVTGSVAQCEAAIREAQLYNLLAGWWSLGSLVVWNWVALVTNFGARKALRRLATQPYVEHPRPMWTPPNGTAPRWPAG